MSFVVLDPAGAITFTSCGRTPSFGRRPLMKSLRSRFGPRKDQTMSSPTNMPIRSAPLTRRPATNTPTDAPPAYTAAPNSAPMVQPAGQSGSTAPVADDQYAFLGTFDTVFLIDDSSSMTWKNELGISRWSETGDALAAITPICTAHDADGIDIVFLNTKPQPVHRGITSAGVVQEIFQTVIPSGGTPIGWRLDSILRPYLRAYTQDPDSTKPLNVICITDGEAGDDPESVLIDTAKQLDRLGAPSFQVGVQFFQVGDDRRAGEYLRALDNDLRTIAGNAELRDIVDTVPFTSETGSHLTGEGILKVVLGAVNRRLDRKDDEGLHH